MQCNACGREIPDGASFCPICGASQKAPSAPGEPAPLPPVPLPPEPRRRRRGVGGCLIALLVIIVIVGLLVGGWWLIGRRMLTNRLFDQYAANVSDGIDFNSLSDRRFVQVLSEDEINDYVGDALPSDMGPVKDVWIELRKGGLEVHILVWGMELTLQADVEQWRSGVQITEPSASGLLGWIVEPTVLADRVEELINTGLKDNDIRLVELEITTREFTYRIEPR